MRYLLLLALSFGSLFQLQAQFATFEAKTFLREGGEYELTKLQQMTWIIEGKSYRYGDAPARVPVNPNKVDTMLYQRAVDKPWESILFKVAAPRDYVFNINTCCDGFEVRLKVKSKTAITWKKTLNFRLVDEKDKANLLARHSATGALLSSQKMVSVKSTCGSAMASNIYPFSLEQYVECSEEAAGCEHMNCLVVGDDYRYDFYFRTEKVLVSGLYMPLGDWEVTLTYDLETGETEVH